MMSENITEEMLEVRAKLMMAPLEVLTEILKEYAEPVDSSRGRFKVAMQADRFFMKEMEDEQAQTTLLAVKLALENVNTSTDKTVEKATVKIEASNEPASTKTESPSAVKLHKDFKISGQIDCKSGISYTSLIRQIETGKQKGYSDVDVMDGVIKAVVSIIKLTQLLRRKARHKGDP